MDDMFNNNVHMTYVCVCMYCRHLNAHALSGCQVVVCAHLFSWMRMRMHALSAYTCLCAQWMLVVCVHIALAWTSTGCLVDSVTLHISDKY